MRRRRTTTQVLEGLHGDALARLVAKYQRVPWLDRGRGWEGVDCWGLVRLFYLEELGIELPSYAEGYVSAVEREQVSRLIRGQLDEWQRPPQPSFADVAVAWTKREEILSHVGLYVGDGLVLSAQPDALPIAEEVQRTWWSSHLEGYYRYPIAAARIAQPSTRLLPARLSARQHGGSLGDRPIYVTVSDHPLSMRLRSREVPAGGTVEDILVELGLDPGFGPVRVIHGETVIEAPNWRRLRPKGGTVLVVRPLAGFPIIPFLIIAAQAIASAAAGFASGALAALGATSAAGSIGAGIGGGFVGAFNVGAFFGAAFVKIAVLSAVSFGLQQATKSIAAPSGSSGPEPATSPSASRVGFGANETRRYDPIPVGYGRYRRVPDEYALPFTEVAGKERYVRRMLMNGQGRYRVTDVRVNDRPIEDIDGATWHVVEGGVAASYEAEILDAEPDQDAPRHWWRLNGNANDRMTPALDLAASGVVWSSGLVADDADQCAQIGAGDSIGSTTSPATTATDNWTIEALVEIDPADQSDEPCIFHNGNDASGYGVYLVKTPGATKPRRLRVRFPGAATQDFDLANMPPVIGDLAGHQLTHHIALRRKNGRTDIFLDGARGFVTDTVVPTTPAGAFGIGVARSGSTWGHHLVGKIDEVAVYETPLGDEEIYWHWYLATIGLRRSKTRGGAVRWYGNIVREVASNVLFTTPSSDETDLLPEFHEVSFHDPIDEFNIVYEMPSGIYRLSENGAKRTGKSAVEVRVEVRWREESEPDWTVALDRVHGPMYERKSFVQSLNVVLPARQPDKPAPRYRIQFRARWDTKPSGNPLQIANSSFRTGAHDTSIAVADVNFWYVQGIVHDASSVGVEGCSILSVRIPYESNGTISCFSERLIPVYDPSDPAADPVTGFTPERVEASAAQCALDVLRNPEQNPDPYPDSEIAHAEFLELYESTEDVEVGLLADYQSTTDGLANQILSLASASLDDPDGTVGLVRERRSLIPVGLITPRSYRSFKGTLTWPELPHAHLVRWTDADHNDERREMVVYASGYNEKGTDGKMAAGKFATMEILGLRNKELVKKHVRLKQELVAQRSERWEVEGFLDQLPLRRGYRVEFAHPAAAIGYRQAPDGNRNRITGFGQMRVVRIDTSGGNVTNVYVEQPLTYEVGKSYGVTYRRVHETLAQVDITTRTVANLSPQSPTTKITLASPEPIATAPQVDDLLAFGEVNLVTVPAVIHSIRYHPGFTATVSLVPYVPGIWAVYDDPDANAPPRELGISRPTPLAARLGAKPPRILGIASDERYLTLGSNGQAEPHMALSFTAASGEQERTDSVQARYQLAGAGMPWFYSPALEASASPLLLGPVVEGETYFVQMRAAQGATFGPWGVGASHRVVGRLSPPPVPSDVRVDPGLLRWSYPNRPLDLVGFRVRWSFGYTNGNSWGEATPAHDGIVYTNDFPLATIPTDEVITVMVKAVDQLGIESLHPGFVVLNIGGPVGNVILDVDHKALGWPGTKINCTVVSTELRADSTGATGASPAWPKDATGTSVRGNVRCWPSDGTLPAWPQGGRRDSKEALYRYSFVPEGSGVLGQALLFPTVRQPTDAGGSSRYRAKNAGPAWKSNPKALAWDGDGDGDVDAADALLPAWAPPGEWYSIAAFTPTKRKPYEVELVLVPKVCGFNQQAGFVAHNVRSDVDDLVEFLNDIPIEPEGTRLPLARRYSEIKQIRATLQRGSGNAIGLRIVSYSVDGPLVQAVDGGGATTAALGDFEVRGVPQGSTVRVY